MTQERPSPEIEELHAYVDGQLGPEAQRRVAERLARESRSREQVEAYAAIRDDLKALYDPVASEPIPPRLLARRQRRPWLQPLGALAASLALLLAGGFIGMHLQGSRFTPLAGTPSVVREAAMAYAVYTPEVRHPVEVPGEQEQHLVSWLTKRMGVQLRVPQLASLGFHLVGGRLLSSDDGPGALLMYEDGQGRRVILYACHNEEKDRNSAFRFAQEEGISVFHWLEGPLSYALAGEIERTALLAIAEAVYQQISV